ncbi:hypothetical protein ACX80E_04305 [Arthrobacter sp. TMN-49]
MRISIRATVASVALATLFSLAACSAPPTTTYPNGAGQDVTVNWRDYPLSAGSLPDDLALTPVSEDAEAISAGLLGEIKTALTAEYGMAWESAGEAGWFPTTGNGYGGETMTTSYNSHEWRSTTLPAATTEWKKIMGTISGLTAARGLGPVKLTQDSGFFNNDPAWQKKLVEKYGTADPQQLYWWNGTAYSGSQWLAVTMVNVDRDTTGRAATEYQELKLPARSISISYGVATVARDDLPALKQALEPFMGLTPPEATTSD